jgi:PWWP domain
MQNPRVDQSLRCRELFLADLRLTLHPRRTAPQVWHLVRLSSGPANPPLAPETTLNGDTEKNAPPPAEPTSVPVTAPAKPATEDVAQEDTEMKDATEPAVDNADAAPEDTALEANGTSAAKKASNGRRKSGGVPEHKNKKLNKKKSMSRITHLDAQPGGYYFARLKSYPPWPSIICDEDMLPDSLLTTRPITTKKADGTYNEAYSDGGKKVTDRTFPVMFLYTNEL